MSAVLPVPENTNHHFFDSFSFTLTAQCPYEKLILIGKTAYWTLKLKGIYPCHQNTVVSKKKTKIGTPAIPLSNVHISLDQDYNLLAQDYNL